MRQWSAYIGILGLNAIAIYDLVRPFFIRASDESNVLGGFWQSLFF